MTTDSSICSQFVLHLLQTLPGYFTETEPFLLETVPQEIMLPVPRLLQLMHSFKILLPIFNLPSFKPSWKTPKSMMGESEPAPSEGDWEYTRKRGFLHRILGVLK